MADASNPSESLRKTSLTSMIDRQHVELFLISFLALFQELACIRWFGSTVIFLTFFTNLVLMACFLGISVGCRAARSRRDFLGSVIPLTLFTMALAFALLWGYNRYAGLMIDVGNQASAQQVYFGTEIRRRDLSAFVVPLEVVAGTFFLLISLSFLGIGQAMGRAFNAIADPIEAYTANLLGSLAGIAGFGVLAYLQSPPPVWFAITCLMVLYILEKPAARVVSTVAAALLIAGLFATAERPDLGEGISTTIWSPYYKIRFEPETRRIYVNNIHHQMMEDLNKGGAFYQVSYLMDRAAGGPPLDDVLIIGAGSGNDVATALAQGAKHVDAVEIDPALHEIGRRHHPNRHGDDPRVSWHIDDGRSFLRSDRKAYDLIVYALVDSLVLHSGYSSIRLESFLYTEQAFRDLKDHLKPGGILVVYNYYRQGWVVGRLAKLAERVFEAEPIVFTLPYREVIAPQDNRGDVLSFLLIGTEGSAAMGAIRAQLQEGRSFWVHPDPAVLRRYHRYGAAAPDAPGAPSSQWYRLGPARVQTEGIGRLPTDDYPFLYLRDPAIPGLNVRGILLVAGLSVALLLALAPVRTVRPNGRMFFLGAGFLLLETKGVVHLALLFGSTWMVNSIVFAAILVMALLSNLYVRRVQPRRLAPYYLGLLAALVLNLIVPMTSFLALPGAIKVVLSCLVVFVPVFFAGLVFAASFRDSHQPDLDFGSNIGGAILGGLSENLSLVVGFNNLLILAMAYYVLSALLAPRRPGPAG
jgi:SAM-dependent methyltransferase